MNYTELLLARVREANEKYALFKENERVLVGFSGGADSLVLLCVLHTLLGGNVCALHVNHMIRGEEADADERFCRLFCESRGIPFSCERIDVPALARGKALEETARSARYSALAAECERVGASKIALAHTASDNAETVLFNLARGTALAGLRGIPPKRWHGELEVVRPLILCTREDIEGYAKENLLAYRTDSTNADVHYTRNFIRHRVLPLLKQINPALCTRLSATSDALRADEDFIAGCALAFMRENGIGANADVQKLLALHRAVRTRVIASMYAQACSEHLEEKHFADIESLLCSGKEGARVILPGKIAALLCGGSLCFMQEEKFLKDNEKPHFRERVPLGTCDLGGAFATLLCKKACNKQEKEEEERLASQLSQKAVFSASVLLPESTVQSIFFRSRENGDKYLFGGMTRTLKKLLSGGTEAAKRFRPVFCDENGIFWFPGFRLRDDVYRTEEEKTYILHYFEY